MLLLTGWGSWVQAQPANTSQSPLAPDQSWPTLNGMVNAPNWLNLGLNVQSSFLGNPTGGTTKATNWVQQTTFDATVSPGLNKDRKQWTEADHWTAHLELMVFSGTAGYGEAIGNAYALTATDHPTGLWLTEATIQRKDRRGAFDIKAGIFSVNPGSVEAPVLNSYVNSVFNNTLNLNINNIPINPFVAPGIQLHWQPGQHDESAPEKAGNYGDWHYAAFLLDPENNLSSLFGVNPGQQQINGHSQMLQWSFSKLPGTEIASEPIHNQNQLISRQLPPPLLQIGAGYLYDKASQKATKHAFGSLTILSQLPIGLDNRFWIGASGGDKTSLNLAPLFLSGGWLSQGILPGRPLDVLALGYGRSSFNNDINPGYSQESTIELNYNIAFNSTLSAQPFAQWMLNPAGNRSVKNIVALGIQLQLQF